ncbi:MAG: HD domain-containing protein [Neisseriaceae bacterium]|nr:MAG: HD domain-containing protein [Neisseriaceae bacterium]
MTNYVDEIENSFAFLREIDKLKSIYRKAKIKSDGNRYENSAEHSWHAALAAQVLQNYFELDVDINKVIQMLLVHDLVEIYAGDTPAFAENVNYTEQHNTELLAIENLANKFPLEQVQKFKNLWLEYEELATSESKFALCIDRIMPIMQNIHNYGGSWREFNVSKSKLQERNKLLKELSPKLWQFVNQQFDIAIANGWISAE